MAYEITAQMDIDGVTNLINTYKVVKTFSAEFIATSVTVCNRNNAAVNVRLAFVPTGGATNPPAGKSFVFYDSLGAYKTLDGYNGSAFELGASIVLYSDTANVNISISGDSK